MHQDFFAERAGHLALANKKAKDAAMAELARGLDSESEDADNEAREKPESTELETTPGRRDPQVPVTVPEILALEKKRFSREWAGLLRRVPAGRPSARAKDVATMSSLAPGARRNLVQTHHTWWRRPGVRGSASGQRRTAGTWFPWIGCSAPPSCGRKLTSAHLTHRTTANDQINMTTPKHSTRLHVPPQR